MYHMQNRACIGQSVVLFVSWRLRVIAMYWAKGSHRNGPPKYAAVLHRYLHELLIQLKIHQ